MEREDLLEKYADPIRVLDQGYVKIVDVMGGDLSVVEAARTSYVRDVKEDLKDRTESQNENLIRYMLRNGHTSPFEMVEAKFQVKVPMDCWRQWVRHRTANINEYSTRYSEAVADKQETCPLSWRKQSKSNKQGSEGYVREYPEDFTSKVGDNDPGEYLSYRERTLHELSEEVYRERLQFGVAREQARKDLPLSNYTVAVWKIDGSNLFKFLSLRMHPHAQEEIREYAKAIFSIVQDWLPLCSKAFHDYVLESKRFSKTEVTLLSNLLKKHTQSLFGENFSELSRERKVSILKEFVEEGTSSMMPREWREFLSKIGLV